MNSVALIESPCLRREQPVKEQKARGAAVAHAIDSILDDLDRLDDAARQPGKRQESSMTVELTIPHLCAICMLPTER